MRVLAQHPDVLVFVSRAWQTTCTAVRSGEEGFVVDSPVYPDELEALQGVLEQAGFPVSGLLATHADWDHLLGRLAFPQAALGVAHSTTERLSSSPGQAQRELRHFDEEHYVAGRGPLALAAVQELPVPGRLALGQPDRPEHELELHPADGHTSDGMAIWIPWAEILLAGDYLSPVEIPVIESLESYRATLERLSHLVARADTVVPGHGDPLTREAAGQVLERDIAYLDALEHRGAQATLPPDLRTATQRAIHARNVERLLGAV